MRGEGNHKIPGSFAPENMEKTGAERVKYSLACQHEDAIPIKFVSYAQKCPTVLCTFAVALRKESVDRNDVRNPATTLPSVALRKESVDRNDNFNLHCVEEVSSLSARRAWIEIIEEVSKYVVKESLSARRAWIEIWLCGLLSMLISVALRKESVDRNYSVCQFACFGWLSLSARRAWIEMQLIPLTDPAPKGRSPQGERG